MKKECFPTLGRLFVLTAGALLFATAAAKIMSALGSARILNNLDPLFDFSFRSLFWFTGIVELFVAFICFFHKAVKFQAGLVAWLSFVILLYRVGLYCVGYHKPCSCLGTLTQAINLSPEKADFMMKCVLAYLLSGGVLTYLFCNWKKEVTSPSPESCIEPVTQP